MNPKEVVIGFLVNSKTTDNGVYHQEITCWFITLKRYDVKATVHICVCVCVINGRRLQPWMCAGIGTPSPSWCRCLLLARAAVSPHSDSYPPSGQREGGGSEKNETERERESERERERGETIFKTSTQYILLQSRHHPRHKNTQTLSLTLTESSAAATKTTLNHHTHTHTHTPSLPPSRSLTLPLTQTIKLSPPSFLERIHTFVTRGKVVRIFNTHTRDH